MNCRKPGASASIVSRAHLFGACATATLVAAGGVATAAAPVSVPTTDLARTQFLKLHMIKPGQLKATTLVQPPSSAAHAEVMRRLAAVSPVHGILAGPTTVPYWTSQITSPLDGNTYTFSMVGSSPYAATPSNTNVQYVPVEIRVHLDGFTFDPSQPTPSYGNPNPGVTTCDSQGPGRRFFNSPIFRPVTSFNSNGVNVAGTPGGQQLISAFQRANFWQAVHGTNYGVTLIPTRLNPIVVDWTPSDPNDTVVGIPDNCGGTAAVPFLNLNEVDSELQAIGQAYGTATQIPASLLVDAAIYEGTNPFAPGYCCILGYHNAVPFGANGVQVYAIGAYFDTNGAFGPDFADTTIWAHELSELMNDPFVQSIPNVPGGYNNAVTPAWGHSGQVAGCQNNLETGDPLTPGEIGNYPNHPVIGVGGFVYHFQDLVFHDWFYRTPSTSTGGYYSFVGTFHTSAGPLCVGGSGTGGSGHQPIL